VVWELEAESFIRHDLLAWANEPRAAENDPRALLVIDQQTGALVGVTAHESLKLGAPGEESFVASWLVVVGVSGAGKVRRSPRPRRASRGRVQVTS
jgi:hypothetical protein